MSFSRGLDIKNIEIEAVLLFGLSPVLYSGTLRILFYENVLVFLN